jgi:hypothetical protein
MPAAFLRRVIKPTCGDARQDIVMEGPNGRVTREALYPSPKALAFGHE